jgi:cytosine/adenosine deaminase-related metal-dependent hydrolase
MTQTINSPDSTKKSFKILVGRIVTADPISGALKKPFLTDQAIEISSTSGRILSIGPTTQSDIQQLALLETSSPSNVSSGDIIDLRNKTVLPGFIDTHVHRE